MARMVFFIRTSGIIFIFNWWNRIQNFLIWNFVKILLNYQLVSWNVICLFQVLIISLFTVEFLFIEHCYFIFFINSILRNSVIQNLLWSFLCRFRMSLISILLCISRQSFSSRFLDSRSSHVTLSGQQIIRTFRSFLRQLLIKFLLIKFFFKNKRFLTCTRIIIKRFLWNFLLILS